MKTENQADMTRTLTIANIVWLKMLRRKDVYVLLIMLGALLAMVSVMNIFELGGMVRYVKDAGLMMAWLFSWILAVNISSREIPEEENRGTIFPLLAKPVNRLEFIAGKTIGCWSIVVTACTMFYILIMLIAALKGGAFNLQALFQAYILHAAAIGIVCAIGVAFSTKTNNDAAAALTYVITSASYLLAPKIPAFLVKAKGIQAVVLTIIYHMFPHFEVFDMRKRLVHDYGPASWKVVTGAFTYGILITIVFIIIAWFSYRNKKFSRANLS